MLSIQKQAAPFALIVVSTVVFASAACGPGGKTPVIPKTTASASSSAGQPTGPATFAPPTPIPPFSKKAFEKKASAYHDCAASFASAGKDPAADVARLAKACEQATKMHLVGDTLRGTQKDSDGPQAYPFKAEAGKCYRAYAATVSGITGLDLAIRDSEGNVVSNDASEGPGYVAGKDAVVCFKEADSASVSVAIGSGAGAYAVQIWSE